MNTESTIYIAPAKTLADNGLKQYISYSHDSCGLGPIRKASVEKIPYGKILVKECPKFIVCVAYVDEQWVVGHPWMVENTNYIGTPKGPNVKGIYDTFQDMPRVVKESLSRLKTWSHVGPCWHDAGITDCF